MRIYKSKLKELFTGTFIEVQKFCTILEDFDIKYIIQDYKQSAVLAGFGITNLYYTHRLLVYENDYDFALKIFKNQKSSLVWVLNSSPLKFVSIFSSTTSMLFKSLSGGS